MPDTVRYSDLDTAASIGGNDLTALAVENSQSETGYSSKKVTMNQLGSALNNGIEYTSELQTTSKKIIGAINELKAGGGGGGSSTLAGLTDVDITTPSNNQVLKYNSTSGKWENGAGGGGGASALDDLTDVEITTPTDDDSLVYNANDSEWQNKPITKTVTQAQYDALVAGGTVDPSIIYFISDGIPSSSLHNYSTTEKAVGKWIDDSTVYEKVCTGTTIEGSVVLTTGVDKIISMTGHAGAYSLPALNIDNNRKYILAQVSGTDAKLYASGSNYYNLAYEVVLRYTKASS